MAIVLGIDGGNSKTLAVAADGQGCVLGVGRAGGGNHQNKGLDAALAEIQAAARAALDAAGTGAEAVDAAFFALAGADLEDDFALLRPALAGLRLGARWEVENDTIAGLRAGAERADAVVVIVGSGTNAAGTNAAGETIRLPGLGWLSGDWGGGGEIAREAVSRIARAWDGRGSPTALTPLVLQEMGCVDVEAFILAVYRGEVLRARLLDVVPLVFTAAAAGDAVAAEIVGRQAAEVATTAGTLIRRLGLSNRQCDVVLAGSVFRDETGQLVREVRSRVEERYPQARIVVSDLEPVLGSVLCAMDLLSLETGGAVRRTLLESFATSRIGISGVVEP